MLKLVTLSALLALAVAAPQYPVFSPYPFPYYQNPLMHYTRAGVRQPIVPVPYYYPGVVPYGAYNPVEAPVVVAPPESVGATKTAAHPQQTKATFRVPVDSGTQQKPFHVQTYSNVEPQVSSYDQADDAQKNPSLQLAELILTPEQKRQLEEAVAAMNPLEFAARLDATKDAREAMRIFTN